MSGYESTEDPLNLAAHLERIAQRDYCGVNEGYWILRDAATLIRQLQRQLPRDPLPDNPANGDENAPGNAVKRGFN